MKHRNRYSVGLLALAALLTTMAPAVWAQAVGGAEKARPVAGDPGATRRMHSHDTVAWIVFTLVTGKLVLTFEGEAPIEVEPGQVLSFKGTTRHTFRNVAGVTATIVEVFGKTERPKAEPPASRRPSE
jgi:quercetin dioxygenase-like cupin family protein